MMSVVVVVEVVEVLEEAGGCAAAPTAVPEVVAGKGATTETGNSPKRSPPQDEEGPAPQKSQKKLPQRMEMFLPTPTSRRRRRIPRRTKVPWKRAT